MLFDSQTIAFLKKKYSQELIEDVDVKVFTRDIIVSGEDPEYNQFSKDLVRELSQLNNKIKPEYLSFGDESAEELDLSFSPTIIIGKDNGYSIQYWGAPAGHIAGAFFETVSLISQRKSGLDDSLRKRLKNIDKNVLVETYFSLDSPASSQAVLLSNQIAVEMPGRIMSRAIEIEEAVKKGKISKILNLPFILINEEKESQLSGLISKDKLLYQLIVHGSSNADALLAEIEEEEKKKRTLVDKPDYPIFLNTSNFDEAIKKYQSIVIDCWAEWCAPCLMIHPIIENLAKKYKGKIAFAKLNIDENREIAERFSIMSIPALLVFRFGKNVDSIIGAMPQDALEEKIKNYVT